MGYFRKTAILIGGSNELGKTLAKRFGKTWFKKWNVVNIDKVANPDCTHNILIDFEQPISSD
jgi:hypothetical protein